MEIHKPRAAHNWREFLIEIGTITCGILIAVGLEQGLEWLHRRELVASGENALRENFVRFVGLAGTNEQESACLDQRGPELRAILDRAGETRRLPRVGPIPQPAPHPWEIDTWDAMVASGAAPYLPQSKIVLYSRIARSGVDMYTAASEEWTEWGALQSLSGAPRGFSAPEEAKARDTLARAVQYEGRVRHIATVTIERIRQSGLLDQKAFDDAYRRGGHPPRHIPACSPIAVSDG